MWTTGKTPTHETQTNAQTLRIARIVAPVVTGCHAGGPRAYRSSRDAGSQADAGSRLSRRLLRSDMVPTPPLVVATRPRRFMYERSQSRWPLVSLGFRVQGLRVWEHSQSRWPLFSLVFRVEGLGNIRNHLGRSLVSTDV